MVKNEMWNTYLLLVDMFCCVVFSHLCVWPLDLVSERQQSFLLQIFPLW